MDYYGKNSFEHLNMFHNKSGCVSIIKVKIEKEVLLLIILDNGNIENEQLSMLFDLSNMLIDDINNKNILFRGDCILFLEAKLEAQGGNPVLKKKYLGKLIQI